MSSRHFGHHLFAVLLTEAVFQNLHENAKLPSGIVCCLRPVDEFKIPLGGHEKPKVQQQKSSPAPASVQVQAFCFRRAFYRPE